VDVPAGVWVHEVVRVGPSGIEGRGLFATEALGAGTAVLRLGGHLVDSAALARRIDVADADPDAPYVDSISVDDDLHLVLPTGTAAHFGNHSCDPNLWHSGPLDLVARRDIAPGEELTVDYGTNSARPGFALACHCGTALCRGAVSGDDWRRPELQERYDGHWVPVLAARIRRG
jgi:hypothetical protein